MRSAKKKKKSKKGKSKVPSFVHSLKLTTEKWQEDVLDKRLDIGRRIYNACLNELYKRYRTMAQSKEYQQALKLPKGTDAEKAARNRIFYAINKKNKLTEYSMHDFVKPIQHHYTANIDSLTAQAIATRCFNAFKGQIYHTAKKVHFKKYDTMDSLEGKNNASGIKYRDGTVSWGGLEMKAVIGKHDEYAEMALQRKIKYCRILRNGTKYYLQLVLEGFPPVKLNKDGSFRHKVGDSGVGIDMGTQTSGTTSDQKVCLQELAPEINTPYRKIRKLQRKMDRSRRAMNPDKYNENGTINRSNKNPWIKSKHYLEYQQKYRRTHGKLKDIRRQSHNQWANEIISQGTNVYVELMPYKGLQKRAKKTTYNSKTGKINSKHRFGKSLANKAPASALVILDNKLIALGSELNLIDTVGVKASQYNHLTDDYVKKKLSERWTMVGEDKIQRDLYSSFLIKNVNSDLCSINREKCLQKFEKFKTMHNEEIARLRASGNRKISSMGI